jgi:hypothetical protein
MEDEIFAGIKPHVALRAVAYIALEISISEVD